MGLDGLQADGLGLDAADLVGGLVYPPLYWGTGGGQGAYSWTVMMPEAADIAAILRFTRHSGWRIRPGRSDHSGRVSGRFSGPYSTIGTEET